jgi:hypothetical protein
MGDGGRRGSVRRAGALATIALVAACGESISNDASTALDAAEAPDAELGAPDAIDLTPDAHVPQDGGGPPETGVLWHDTSCQPCSSCARTSSAACLTVSATREQFCADSCAGNVDACVTGFTCQNIGTMAAPQLFCIPPAGSCRLPGTGEGTECFGDTATCLRTADACEGDVYALGYCTHTCSSDQDCAPPYACLMGTHGLNVCKARFLGDAELCGRNGSFEEIPCAVDDDCLDVPDARCVRDESTLPGVCGAACRDSQDCTAPSACLFTARGSLCLTPACACHGTSVPSGTRDLFGEALEAAGLTRCGAIFNVFTWSLQAPDILEDPYRLSFYDRIHSQPLASPDWATSLVKTLDGRAKADPMPVPARAARMVEDLAMIVDRPAKPHAAGMPDPIAPLATAVERLITASGGVPNSAEIAADASDVPMDLQLALAEVIDGISRAATARANALQNVPANGRQSLYDYGPAYVAQRSDGLALDPTAAMTKAILNQQLDYGEMYGGAVDVLDAIAQADLGRFAVVPTATIATSTAVLLFSQETPIGRIAIGDANPGIYDSSIAAYAGPWALLVDLGGNDVYRTPVGGNTSFANAVSVMIDLGGDDLYAYVEVPDPKDGTRLPSDGRGRYHPVMPPTRDNGPISFSEIPRQGGARLGTAVLVDLGGGRDRYVSLRMSQGSGVLGTGVLVDDGGNDSYSAETVAQGAGAFGIGILYDVAGDDVHEAYSMAQGFGFARGAGLVYDVSGDDRYLMDVGDPASGGDPLYFNAQRPGMANSTLGQGWGFGRRADQTDRAFMSGGIGILVDAAGKDQYQGSIFTQGGGFWFGTGILADESGDDRYDGMWYAMGAAAHYSLGFLLEGDGNDMYGGALPRINVTQGGGHDFSAAFLIDEAGNDIYNGARITLGCGNSNGMGFFADNGGDDQYSAISGFAIGAGGLVGSDVDFPGSPRHRVNTVGIFMDASGHDTYERQGMMSPMIADDQTWTQVINMDPMVNLVEKGAGVDGQGDTTLHARF